MAEYQYNLIEEDAPQGHKPQSDSDSCDSFAGYEAVAPSQSSRSETRHSESKHASPKRASERNASAASNGADHRWHVQTSITRRASAPEGGLRVNVLCDPHGRRSSAISVAQAVIPSQNHPHSAPMSKSELETQQLADALKTMTELKEFLASAPTQFGPGDFIRQFQLPSDEQVSCVRWNKVFCITGTDIVRSLVFRFSVIGREVINRKKFEEGVFSDLRNLKINVDARLESPKSELLELLYKHHCVRTKKKQKVFFWYSVQHDQLFMDTLERELKREQACEAMSRSQSGTTSSSDRHLLLASSAATKAVREPALSFKYDSSLRLIDQISSITKGLPHDFATLVDATTTGMSIPLNTHSISTAPSVTEAPVSYYPVKALDQNYSRLDYACSLPPVTPNPSLDSADERSSPWYNIQTSNQQVYATPDSVTGLSNPNSVTPLGSSGMPVWTQSIYGYEHKEELGARPSTSNVAAPELEFNNKGTEGSDFPLDFFAQHENEQKHASINYSFQNKYHDFVYYNRPALSTSLPLESQDDSSSFPAHYVLSEQDSEWNRSCQDEQDPAVEGFPVSQELPEHKWTPVTHRKTLDPPFELSSVRNAALATRGAGRVRKYRATANSGMASMSGRSFTRSY